MNLGPSELTFDGIKNCTQNPNVHFWGQLNILECRDPSCNTSFKGLNKIKQMMCLKMLRNHPSNMMAKTYFLKFMEKPQMNIFIIAIKMKRYKLIDLLL